MQQYEYASFAVGQGGDLQKVGDETIKELNRYAREGWRLVSTVYVPYTGPQGNIRPEYSSIHYYMERPLQSYTSFR